MEFVTATDIQNNFGKFLSMAQDGIEIVITKNGIEVARLISKEKTVSFLSDTLVGVISPSISEKQARAERLAKYENFG